jgi:hypothetical protein
MRRVLIGLTAGVLAVLGLAGTASAREHCAPARAHYRGNGHRFTGGCYYTRAAHPRWGRCVWDDHCRRWQYWDANRCAWYYWSPQYSCYYPTTHCP